MVSNLESEAFLGCPICNERFERSLLPPFCPKCAWDLKSDPVLHVSIEPMNEEDLDAYNQRVFLAIMNWKRLHTSQKGNRGGWCPHSEGGQGGHVVSVTPPRDPRYRLRSTSQMVSEDEFKLVFGLNDNLQPLAYIENDYLDNSDGTVTDNATGLMWLQSGNEQVSYDKAETAIRLLNGKAFAGYNDWRLPTIPELMSLLEPEKKNGVNHIAPVFDKEDQWCWSADKRSSDSAWHVYFGYGHVMWFHLIAPASVRAVRSCP